MSKIIFKTLFKKELFNILNSYSFWIAFIFFYLALSFGFVGLSVWFDIGLSDFSYFFSLFPFAYIVVIPMLTIEVWTDEYKRQTSKLLFLFPASLSEIVIAKFFACCVCFFIQVVATILIPISVSGLTFFYLPSFLFSYIASFCFGLACISISLALSSLSSESAVAFVFSFLTIAFFSLLHFVPRLVNIPKWLRYFIETISFNKHFQNATLGILDLSDYVFYGALILFGLALNVFVLKLKRSKE